MLIDFRGGSRTAESSKMERLVIIVNSFQPLTIITKRSILDVASILYVPLTVISEFNLTQENKTKESFVFSHFILCAQSL